MVKRGFKLSADIPNDVLKNLFCIIWRDGHLNAAQALIDAISSMEAGRASDLMNAMKEWPFKYLEEAVEGSKPEMAFHIHDLIIKAKLPEIQRPQTGWEKFRAFLGSLLPGLWNYLSGFFR